MKEVLDAAFIADESESFVDEEACDCPGRHTRSPPFRTPGIIPRVLGRLRAPTKKTVGRGPAESVQP